MYEALNVSPMYDRHVDSIDISCAIDGAAAMFIFSSQITGIELNLESRSHCIHALQ